MKRFNVCKNFHTVFNGMKISFNAFYGKDNRGLWVCDKKPFALRGVNIVELYRFDEALQDWTLTKERGETADFIVKTIKKYGLENLRVSRPVGFTLDKMSQKTLYKKTGAFKRANEGYAHRNDVEILIPLDFAERVMCKLV